MEYTMGLGKSLEQEIKSNMISERHIIGNSITKNLNILFRIKINSGLWSSIESTITPISYITINGNR